MTILVTGASGVLGHALVPRLLRRDEVRVCVRRPETAEPLRAMGAKVAIGPFDQPDHLVEILPRVVTLIHLTGGPNQPDRDALFEANHGSALIGARRRTGGTRAPLRAGLGAGGVSRRTDPFLRAKGLAEEAVATSGLDHVILRCSHAYGIGGLWFAAVVEGATESAARDRPGRGGAAGRRCSPRMSPAIEDHGRGARGAALVGTWALEDPTSWPCRSS